MMIRLLLIPTLLAGGCSYAMMTDSQLSDSVDQEKALVVVYRPTWKNSTRDYAVYDGGTLMGFAASGTYFEYRCEPGEHLFMQLGNSGLTDTAVLATLEGGRTYYLRSDTVVGLLTMRLLLDPVRQGSVEMKTLLQDLDECVPMQLVPENAEGYIEDLRARVEERRLYFEELGEAACKMMLAEDGQ